MTFPENIGLFRPQSVEEATVVARVAELVIDDQTVIAKTAKVRRRALDGKLPRIPFGPRASRKIRNGLAVVAAGISIEEQLDEPLIVSDSTDRQSQDLAAQAAMVLDIRTDPDALQSYDEAVSEAKKELGDTNTSLEDVLISSRLMAHGITFALDEAEQWQKTARSVADGTFAEVSGVWAERREERLAQYPQDGGPATGEIRTVA